MGTNQKGLYVTYSMPSGGSPIDVSIVNSKFTNLYYPGSGGVGAYISMDGNLNVEETIMQNITCYQGCGFYLSSPTGTSKFTNCYFVNNTAGSAGGGAIYLSSGSSAIDGSVFVNNVAGGDGGAITAGNSVSSLSVTNSNFTQCQTDDDGGAIYVTGSLVVDSSVFTSNVAEDEGGAIHATGSVSISNSKFIRNSATTEGGAFYTSASSTKPGSITKCVFSHNSAATDGGAVYQYSGTLQLVGVEMNNNTAAGNGGSTFTRAALNIIGGYFEDNAADSGGALYIDSYPTSVNIRGAEFSVNEAQKNGGGFACVGDAGVFMDQADFTGNVASSGSAYYCNTCTVTSGRVTIDPDNSVQCAQ